MRIYMKGETEPGGARKPRLALRRLEAGVAAAVLGIIASACAYLVLSGETYGTLKTTVDQHSSDIDEIRRTLNDPKDGLVPKVNQIGQEVHDLHEWAKP